MNVVADHEGTTRRTIASEGMGRANNASSPWVNTGVIPWVLGQSATLLTGCSGKNKIIDQNISYH